MPFRKKNAIVEIVAGQHALTGCCLRANLPGAEERCKPFRCKPFNEIPV